MTDQNSEWVTAHGVIAEFDGYLDALRKYGLGLVTGLLTATSLLDDNLDLNWKFASIYATLVLIVALHFIDRNYRVFQEAAAARAATIERRSGIKLTQAINEVYRRDKIGPYFSFMYSLLLLATLVLGWLVLSNQNTSNTTFLLSPYFLTVPTGLSFLTIIATEYGIRPRDFVDIDIDGFSYKKGDRVLLTVTKIGKKSVVFRANTPLFRIWKEESNGERLHAGSDIETNEDFLLRRGNYNCWSIDTDGLAIGVYRIVYYGPVFRTRFYGRRLEKIGKLIPYFEEKPSILRDEKVASRLKKKEGDERWNDGMRFLVTNSLVSSDKV